MLRKLRIHPVIPFITPMLLLMAVIVLFPVAYSIYLSFSKISTTLTVDFIGVDNYANIFSDPSTWRAFRHSLSFTFLSVGGQFLLGLVSALLLNLKFPARRLFRLFLLLPWVVPTIVTTLTWRWMLDSQFGLINDWMVRLGLLDQFRSWLGHSDTALLMGVLVSIWRGFPFIAIMLLAGMQNISLEMYEAAKIDGANATQSFWYITLPALRYTTAVSTMLSAIWAFKEFVVIQTLTEGGPAGTSEVLVTLVYKLFFQFYRFGDSAALGVLILVILMIFSAVYINTVTSKED